MKNFLIILCILFLSIILFAENKKLIYGAFSVSHEVKLPDKPEIIYDSITGDISDWWDHSIFREVF